MGKNNQLYEALKKEYTFNEEFLPKPLTLINAYSVRSIQKHMFLRASILQ